MQQPHSDKKPGLSWSTPISNDSSPTTASKPNGSMPLTLPKMSPNNGNMTARYMGIFVGGLIVGVVVAWGWSTLKNHTSTATTASSTVASANKATIDSSKKNASGDISVASSVVLGSEALTLVSPQRAGLSVAVSHIEVSKPTWVVVYDDVNGKPGNVLGAQLFFTSGSGTVTLLRATMAGKTYLVGRSVDNGDHRFQKNIDKMIMDASGNPALGTVTAN